MVVVNPLFNHVFFMFVELFNKKVRKPLAFLTFEVSGLFCCFFRLIQERLFYNTELFVEHWLIVVN